MNQCISITTDDINTFVSALLAAQFFLFLFVLFIYDLLMDLFHFIVRRVRKFSCAPLVDKPVEGKSHD